MEIVIRPARGTLDLRLRELWQYRELFWTLAMRAVLVRYKQTAIGVLWAVLQPLLAMVVFTVVFGRLAGLGRGDPLYHLKVFAAVLPWQLFASTLTQSTNSVVSHAGMIQKIYFPRLIIPASTCVAGVIDFCLAAAVFAGLMLWSGVLPGWRVLALPGLVLLAVAAALGAGLWLSALNARYRDFHHVVPFLVRMGIYVSPVGFMSGIVPDRWRPMYALNPMVSVLAGFRWALFDSARVDWRAVANTFAIVFLLLLGGFVYFSRQQRTFADYV